MTEPLLQPDDVCTQLGIKKCTLYDLVAARKIPHIKMGGRLRFRQEHIDQWLEAQVVPVKPVRSVPVSRRFRVG